MHWKGSCLVIQVGISTLEFQLVEVFAARRSGDWLCWDETRDLAKRLGLATVLWTTWNLLVYSHAVLHKVGEE